MSARRVYALVPDLFFMSRIGAVAAQLGVVVEELRPNRAITACRNAPPDLLLLDLHAPGDPLEVIRVLKADDATRGIEIVGFFSHVEIARREEALRAGADRVLPRSAFVARLPELLRGGQA
jgi:CheY-like chemotaxis protein